MHATLRAPRLLSRRAIQLYSSRSAALPARLVAPPYSIRPYTSAPKSHDRGPPSKEDTQTDFAALNVLGNTPVPTTAVDACLHDGFTLDTGRRINGGGAILVGGEAFLWRPWLKEGRIEGTIGAGGTADDAKETGAKGAGGGTGKLLNAKGQWEVGPQALGVLEVVWPKPDLLILGTGPSVVPVAPSTRKLINEMGIRLEIQDTRNAAAQFNLLATERGVSEVAAALVPIGWREGR